MKSMQSSTLASKVLRTQKWFLQKLKKFPGKRKIDKKRKPLSISDGVHGRQGIINRIDVRGAVFSLPLYQTVSELPVTHINQGYTVCRRFSS